MKGLIKLPLTTGVFAKWPLKIAWMKILLFCILIKLLMFDIKNGVRIGVVADFKTRQLNIYTKDK